MPVRSGAYARRRLRLLLPAAVLLLLVVGVSTVPAAALSRAQFPVIATGSQGADVLALQRLLRHDGRSPSVSGLFDAATRSALIDFQRAQSLPDDGVARPATWRALAPRLAIGSSGEAVRALQEQLNAKRDAGLSTNGVFDAATESHVRQLQRRIGLPRTGVVDTETWRHLLWLFTRPRLADGLCGYEVNAGRSPKWGTAAAIAQLERAARLYGERTGSRLAVGDISLALGANIGGHATHEVGMDVDIRPARRDGRECRWGIAYTMRTYDRAGTRALIEAIRDAAPGRVKLIYFNDPVLVREGLVRRYPNHDAHLHVRYCEVDHPKAAYRCPAAARQAAAELVAGDPAEPASGPQPGATVRRAWPMAGYAYWAV